MLFFRLRGLLVANVEKILEKLQHTNGEVEFLKEYCASFESFTTGTGYISELFRYLVGVLSILERVMQLPSRAKSLSTCHCRTDIGSDTRTAKLEKHPCQESSLSQRYKLCAMLKPLEECLTDFLDTCQQLALHIWNDIAFAKLKKRIVNSIVEIYEAARRERSECFDNGEYVAKTVEVGSCVSKCEVKDMGMLTGSRRMQRRHTTRWGCASMTQ